MTLFKPTLLLNRLVVTRNNKYVVDIKFHEGLNIISGENSAGKTTIMRFIAYGLGSENINFNQYAALCDETILEASFNSINITLKRNINGGAQRPLQIFWGSIEEAVNVNISQWQTFPFKRSENKESFSQVLFRLLEMPQLRGESGSNITMHQLLRLIYSDQETTTTDLFRAERFDAAITRAAVGDYLLGIDGNELYELKLEEGTLEKDLASARSAIKTIYTTFGVAGTDINFDFLDERIASISHEIQNIQEKLEFINSNAGSLQKNDSEINLDPKILKKYSLTASSEDDRIRHKLYSTHSELSVLKQRNLELQSEIADTDLFLIELQDRYSSLEESSIAEVYLGAALFKHCPSCFSAVSIDSSISDTCPLCKSTVVKDSAKSQLARMKNELSLQLKESRKIRNDQLNEIRLNAEKIPLLEALLISLEGEFLNNRKSWRSSEDIQMQSLSRNLGAKEQELKNTIELTKLANLLNQHSNEVNRIESRLIWIRGRIEGVTREQANRRLKAYLLVAENIKDLLHKDIDRQDGFKSAENIDIDFASNKLSIDGEFQFSASSMVYLKHSFHMALLLASTQDSSFRFPRLVLLDGIEDGGMEIQRSFDFQKLIKDKSEASNVVHQIILATSNICPELNSEKYIVGSHFTHGNKSISIL